MELSLLEKYGCIEVASRITLSRFPKLKKMAKKLRASGSRGQAESETKAAIDPTLKERYLSRVTEILSDDDIVLLHSSMDGLEAIGISAEDMMEYMRGQVKRGITFVLPCFPITNLKLPTPKSRPYDPKKTLCWTGMLPNAFIGDADVVRSSFPYNSLAAMGPRAQEMMADEASQVGVYDEHSAWRYLFDHHAKILFLGVKASGSNTMAIHATAEFLGDEWPVRDWYEERTYKVRIEGEVSEKTIRVQADHWYQYCMEERTSGRLKEAGVLTEDDSLGCILGVVEDSSEMVDVLRELCKKGKLMYMIPRRYLG